MATLFSHWPRKLASAAANGQCIAFHDTINAATAAFDVTLIGRADGETAACGVGLRPGFRLKQSRSFYSAYSTTMMMPKYHTTLKVYH